MDSLLLASLTTGPTGAVIGLDMTDAQRAMAESLRRRFGVSPMSRATSTLRRSKTAASTWWSASA